MTIKKVFWICLIVILLQVVVAVVLLPKLPDEIPVHWNARGEVDRVGGKLNIFLFPAISLGLLGLMLIIPKIDPLGANIGRSEKPVAFTILGTVGLMTVIFLASAMIAMGSELAMEKIVMLSVGVLFLVIGNYLPKTKRNYFVGIRLPWTLHSDKVWVKTHRFGGWVFVIVGVLFILSLPLPDPLNYYIPFGGMFLSLLILCVYSYMMYKQNDV